MNETGQVSITNYDDYAEIEFSHPKSNSMPRGLLHELAEKITELGRNQKCKVLSLRSSGTGAFCSGAAFNELAELKNIEEGISFFSGFAEVLLAIKNCPVFVICRVHGKAVGGGVGILSASDYVLAHQSAEIRLSELAIGLGPYVIGPAVERKVGLANFSAMAIDAEWRKAEWSKANGLYQEIFEDQTELNNQIQSKISNWLKYDRDAIISLKKVLWEGTESWETLLHERARISARLTLTSAVQERIGKLLAK